MEFDWRAAERLAAMHMRLLGFSDASVTASGADKGIDVSAAAAAAQVKFTATAIGAPAIQALRGAAYGVETVLFYSRAGYTKQALTAADASGVQLFTYTTGAAVTPVNGAAELACANAPAIATDRTHVLSGFSSEEHTVALEQLIVYRTEILAVVRALELIRRQVEERPAASRSLKASRTWIQASIDASEFSLREALNSRSVGRLEPYVQVIIKGYSALISQVGDKTRSAIGAWEVAEQPKYPPEWWSHIQILRAHDSILIPAQEEAREAIIHEYRFGESDRRDAERARKEERRREQFKRYRGR
ncbi:restriction endonuclease [Streptomyces sp. ISL-90]|nr:restriction endonuclease [Streptomyces sp. ISL-90]